MYADIRYGSQSLPKNVGSGLREKNLKDVPIGRPMTDAIFELVNEKPQTRAIVRHATGGEEIPDGGWRGGEEIPAGGWRGGEEIPNGGWR